MQPSDETPIEPTEILELRTETAKHFDNGDGTKTAEIHLYPIHYEKDGELKDINPALVKDKSASDFTHTVDAVEMKIGFIDIYDQPNTFSRTGYDDLVLTPIKANSVKGQIDGKECVYVDAYEQTDVKQLSLGSGLKEYITLKDNGHPSRFTWQFKTTYKPVEENGHIIFYDGDQLAYRISPMVTEATPDSPNFGFTYNWNIDGDMIYFDVGEVPQYPLVIDPSVSPYSSAGDGYVSNMTGSSSWSSARSAGTGTAKDDTGTGNTIQVDVGFSGEKGIRRGFYAFDTSGIGSGQAVTAADLKIYGTSKSNYAIADPDIYIVSGTQASTSSLATSDFGSVGSTSFASIAYASLSTSGYNTFSFNTNGKNAINMTGYTKLAARMGNDYNNTDPGGSFASAYFTAYTSEQSGTSSDPYLSVTYSAAAAAKLPPSKIITQAINRSGSF